MSIVVCGGASETKFLEGNDVFLKLMCTKTFQVATNEFYQACTMSKLYIVSTAGKLHKSLDFMMTHYLRLANGVPL